MTAQNTPTVRGFLRNVFKQVVKFGFSYICLIIGKITPDTFKQDFKSKILSCMMIKLNYFNQEKNKFSRKQHIFI